MDVQEPQTTRIRWLVEPLARAADWMKLLAIVNIILAVASLVASLWTFLWIWLPVWLAILLWRTGNAARIAWRDGTDEKLREATAILGRYFRISGILALISLILTVASFFISVPIVRP